MARPLKQGIEYFSFDVDFFSDVKIRKISRACGPASTSILICLLCNIYRDKGYYIQWDEDLPFVVADSIGTVGITEGAVEEVIKKALQVGFFNQELYDKYKILTSNGIQSRFKSAVARREEIEYVAEYLVSDIKNEVIAYNNPVNDHGSTQSKVKVKRKESKVNRKETKEEKEITPNGEPKKDELSLTHPDRIDFVGLMEYFNSTFNGKLQTIKSIDDKRKKAIKARVAQYGKQAVFDVFQLVLKSEFLLGNNDKNWKCDFDWIFKPANFTKILEGNYNGKRADTTTTRRESVSRLKDLAGAILQGTESQKD